MNYKYLIFGSILIIILIIIYVKRDAIKSYFFGNKVIKDDNNTEIKVKKKKIKIKKDKNENNIIINDKPKKEYIEMTIIVSPEENKEINIGKIKINLFDDIVPKTCENFRSLSKIEYKNCSIHRIIKGFMFQSGDYENHDGTGGKSIFGGKFNDENFTLKHNKRGILSMANSGPDSNGSQFFITFKDAPWLDNKHVVFGEVIDGFEVLDKIENIPVTNDTPNYLIYINNISIVIE